ncbi:endonuclease domain-containing 1 protein-like [Ictalurus furcatus]|uniref:endonuclease domain-containing 1 protein-like n=1 Tax=Ictalurus furcatus TaxID=66913 RepID=UPI002350B427|nr:endonuclease domain-containing 1 protein-like [Ictalurus furcatus]
MKLLTLVLLLSAFSSLTLTEVEDTLSFFKKHCPSFFIPNPDKQNEIIIPTIFPGDQYKKICQHWKNAYRFATVYDTVRRIPVYSAYTLLKVEKTKRSDVWKIEPQLEDIEEYKEKKEMIDSPINATTVGNIINQAVYKDYTGSGYTRGHVFPRSYAANQDQADSTFTLTNIAPQTQNSNGAWAKQVEEPMLKEINKICRWISALHHLTHSSHTPPLCIRMKLLSSEVVKDFMKVIQCAEFFIQNPETNITITLSLVKKKQ